MEISVNKTPVVAVAFILIAALSACSPCPPAAVAQPAAPARPALSRAAKSPAPQPPAVPPDEVAVAAGSASASTTAALPEPKITQPTFSQPVVERHETRGMVLMYHSIDLGLTDRSVWPWDLEAQIQRMRREHTEIIPMSRFIEFLEGKIRLPRHVAVITIDDGERLFFKYGYPIFKKYRAPFALGIITDSVERSDRSGSLSWDELREMMATGLCEIANHSHLHLGMRKMKPEELKREIFHSRDLIAKHLGVGPLAFIYPLGSFNLSVIEQLKKAGYRAAFSVVGNTVTADVHRYAIPRYQVNHRTAVQAMTIWLNWNRWPASSVAPAAGGQ